MDRLSPFPNFSGRERVCSTYTWLLSALIIAASGHSTSRIEIGTTETFSVVVHTKIDVSRYGSALCRTIGQLDAPADVGGAYCPVVVRVCIAVDVSVPTTDVCRNDGFWYKAIVDTNAVAPPTSL